jgi:diguanylate cyclase (GGDEF)-like protein
MDAMTMPLRTLIIEDSEDDTALVLRELCRSGYAPEHERVDTAEALGAALDKQSWDVIISDHSMPQFDGLQALKIVRQQGLDTPFIIVSGSIGEDVAVQAMKAGANDYIMKDKMARLVPAIERELMEAEARHAHRQAQQRVHYLAYHDPLTDLPNLVQFREHLQRVIEDARQNSHTAALLLLDLNNFHEINDTLGYSNGDTLLQEAAGRLLALQRRSDMTARLGGDDFALLLYPGDAAYAESVARHAQEALTAPIVVAGFSLEVGAKIGIALFPDHGANAQLLLQHADVALSRAKQGTLACSVYDPLHDPSDPRRLLLMSDLRAAIHGNSQLAPHFQPKIELQSGKVTGVEALVRWTHPERGPVPPDEFILLAEKTGIIHRLTRLVLEKSMESCYDWHLKGHAIPVAVNLSVKDLLDQTLVDKVQSLLIGRAMEADMLELEITETALMEDPARALEVLTALSDMGIRLHIDDFGTGYSSLGYLKKLPVSAVKIDRSFVSDMISNKDSSMIVRSTVDLAHNLGLKVIAEGVENAEILDRLKTYDCDEAQGYFIAHPMPAGETTRWLAAHPG